MSVPHTKFGNITFGKADSRSQLAIDIAVHFDLIPPKEVDAALVKSWGTTWGTRVCKVFRGPQNSTLFAHPPFQVIGIYPINSSRPSPFTPATPVQIRLGTLVKSRTCKRPFYRREHWGPFKGPLCGLHDSQKWPTSGSWWRRWSALSIKCLIKSSRIPRSL